MIETPPIASAGRLKPSVLRPVVLHAMRDYLQITEPWVYSQIKQTTGYYPVVVCDAKLNQKLFPLPDIHASTDLRFARAHHLINQVHRKLAYANWPGSYQGVIKQYRPQLIHAHFGDRGVLMLGTARKHRVPLVTSFYGYDVSQLPREAKWRPRLEWLFDHGDVFLAEGPHLRQSLLALGCPADKVRIFHLGVDVVNAPFHERRAPAGPTRILMAASFREKKGLRYGIEAFARVCARHRGHVQLTIIGDGPLKDELRALATRLKVMPFIRWLGYQPHDVLIKELASAHLFLSPSVVAESGDTEGGAPVALLEAQASGLPILATTHADIPEVTRPGESAFLVPERDVDALEERLEYLVTHPECWAAMGRSGRAHVLAEFNLLEQGRRLEAIYREAIARH
ncbi:MAG TPA: glycosyltransferase [Oscillatoriaceae cyanobacterium]